VKVYEVAVGHIEEGGKMAIRKIRGMARDAIEASERVKSLMASDERLVASKPLFSLEFGVTEKGAEDAKGS